MRESGGSRSSDVKTIKAGAEMYFGLEKQIVGMAGFEGHEVTRILQERRLAARGGGLDRARNSGLEEKFHMNSDLSWKVIGTHVRWACQGIVVEFAYDQKFVVQSACPLRLSPTAVAPEYGDKKKNLVKKRAKKEKGK